MLMKIGVLLLVVFIVLTVFKKFTKKQELKAKESDKPVDMKQDPICGTFVEEVTDYKVKYYDNIYYFCSDECKQKFIEQKQSQNS